MMMRKIKLASILIGGLVLLALAFPHQFLSEPAANAQIEDSYRANQDDEVFAAVVNSFDLFSSLLQDVYYMRDSVYPVVNKAASLKDAINYLGSGFEADLAEDIANGFLGWDEELSKLVVIPTDSIPIITLSDRKEVKITFINENHAVVQREYENCYREQDRYLYTIHMQKEAAGWKISELSLEEIE